MDENCIAMLSREQDGKWKGFPCDDNLSVWPAQMTMCERIIV
jgi:hypothetical protein